MKTPALLLTSLLFALFGLASPARAATVITAGTDAELRAAVAACGPITFNFDGVIELTSTIDVTCAVTIDASGHAVTISGGNSNRLFRVLPGGSLNLVQLTMANGYVRGTNGLPGTPQTFGSGQPGQSVEAGGILVNSAALSAISCTFSNCSLQGGTGGNAQVGSAFGIAGSGGGAAGGAIAARSSTLNLTNCFFVGNGAGAGNSGLGTFVNDNSVTPGNGNGGAIDISGGTSVVTGCTFRNNSATTSGGGVYVGGAGNATVVQSQFTYNTVGTGGGALGVGSSPVQVSQCRFDHNTAFGNNNYSHVSGGGMLVTGGGATVTDCDFSFNQCFGTPGRVPPSGVGVNASAGRGGALACVSGGISIVTRSTFRQNAVFGGNGVFSSPISSSPSSASGGAIYAAADVRITNCTVVLNQARAGSGPVPLSGASSGGGIACVSGFPIIASCTIASNKVSDANGNNSQGGGIDGSGTPGFLNSILCGNTVNSNFTGNASGSFVFAGNNLSSDGTPPFPAGIGSNNLDALLLPLANNGGATLTMALRVGSPALDTGNPGNFPPTDQRNFTRPSGSGPDIGAYEGVGTPTLHIFRVNASTNALRWIADAGRTYRLDAATILNAWTPFATNVAATNGPLEMLVQVPPAVRYFRLLAE